MRPSGARQAWPDGRKIQPRTARTAAGRRTRGGGGGGGGGGGLLMVALDLLTEKESPAEAEGANVAARVVTSVSWRSRRWSLVFMLVMGWGLRVA